MGAAGCAPAAVCAYRVRRSMMRSAMISAMRTIVMGSGILTSFCSLRLLVL
jgi:hypothetical protein